MDPYLEHPALWPGVHQRLITYLGDRLNTLLPPHYVADIGERLYVVQPERSIYPDVVVVEPPSTAPLPEQQQGSNAAIMTSDPPWVLTVEPVEVREVF
jgi:Uma2 family endonuclease